jgi:crotonobetainyl-CoA:carnitine CoA-transferase CaiB-like acyl-CoA transferase
VLAAFVKLLKTGEGTRVESNLYNAGIDLQGEALAAYLNAGHTNVRYRRDPRLATWFHEAPYGVYQLIDGFLAIPLNDPHLLAKALNSDELAKLCQVDRYEQRDVYAKALAKALATLTFAEVSMHFDKLGIWYAPVLDYDDVAKDPQAKANEVFLATEIDGTPIRLVNHPVRYDGEAPTLRHLAIRPSADARNILRELGHTEEEIRDLASRNIVVVPADG